MERGETASLLRKDSESYISSKHSSSTSIGSVVNDAVSRLVQKFTTTERQRALKDLGIGKAASLIKDAVLGYQDAPYEGFYDPYANPDPRIRNMISIVCGRLVANNWIGRLLLTANWALFILSFLEPPQWCIDSDLDIAQGNIDNARSEYGDCKVIFGATGTAADGQEDQYYYPSSESMVMSVAQSRNTELSCIFIIAVYIMLKMGDDGFNVSLFFYPGYKRWLHCSQCIFLVGLLLGIAAENTVLNPFFRMLILASFLPRFQREFWVMLKMIPAMAYVMMVLAVVVIFYAWFGVVIFYGTEQGANGFQNLIEGIWTLWICITTANYPDVMMPSYNENRLACIYFVSFMSISFFYLMNLILAVSFNAYDNSIADRRVSRNKLATDLLTEAYRLLDPNNTNEVSRETIMAVMLILNQDVPEIDNLSKDEKGIIFGFLDMDGSSFISKDEFLRFGTILLLRLTKKSDYVTFIQRHFPLVYESSWYQALAKYVTSPAFENVVDVVLILNAVVVAIQDYPMLSGQDVTGNLHYKDGSIDTAWESIEAIFTVLYVLEASLKILINGWKQYSESMRNLFDFGVTVLALLATAYVYYPNSYSNSHTIRFIVMIRVLRLARLIFGRQAFEMFGTISVDILPAAANVLSVLLFTSYTFASIGVLLYGGLITRDPANPLAYTLLEASDFVDNDYWANNFNDMLSGMNVLFNLLVINNWTECEIGFEFVTGAKWVRVFFFSFHLVGVVIISNLVTSFIINAYLQQLETVKNRLGWEEEVKGEAILKGAKAEFDATKVTGTVTGAKNIHFVRVNPRYKDIEIDEKEILRLLFTQQSTNIDSIEDDSSVEKVE
mmetsp:Transcript_12926/g.30210  ORF Transcript_12926/g.30210 Transcript_12926/m.30210 type:complete len:840 (+) Transcript_12926:141-2660(+)